MDKKVIWDKITYFKKTEDWGNPEKMNGLLLMLLDNIRCCYDFPFEIHCGYDESGHTKKSQHYLGNAVDFHIESKEKFITQTNKMIKILDELQVSERVGFGIYPDWNNKGFHLDVRGKRIRWAMVNGVYVSFKEGLKNIEG